MTPTTLGKGIETELREGAASIHSEVQESASDQRQNQFQRLQQEGGLGLSRAALHRHKYHHIAGAGCSRRAAHKAITRSSSTVEPESVEPQLEVFPKIQHQQQNYSFVAKGCSSASITTPGNGAITTTTQQQEEEKQQSSSPIAVESPYQQPDSRSSCTTREKQQKEGERTQHEGSTPRLVVAAPAECPVGPRRLEREIKQRSSSAITLSTAASWSQSNRYRAVPLGSESGVAGVAIQSGAAGAGESRTSGSAGSQGQGAVSLRSGGGCSGAQGQHREGAGVASAEQTMMHMQQQEQDQQRKWRQLVDMQLSLSRFPDLTFLAKVTEAKELFLVLLVVIPHGAVKIKMTRQVASGIYIYIYRK